MGHDTHFLSRLSRASAEHVELALSLYRDPVLLKEVLDRSALPDGVERVALNLSPQGQGPYLVLQRNGHFVTCLAEGMTTDDLPIISRARLDAAASQLAVLRERMQAARALAGADGGQIGAVLGRLVKAGPRLSREEFQAQLAFAPLLLRDYLDRFQRMHLALEKDRAVLLSARGRTEPRELAGFHARATWALGHIAAILLAEGPPRDHLLRQPPQEAAEVVDAVIGLVLQTNISGVALRPMHAAARIGKPVLPYFKAKLAASPPGEDLFSSSVLMGIGLAHPKVAGEVAKLLERRTPSLVPLLTERAQEEATMLGRARRAAQALLRDGERPVYERAEDVPDDVAVAAYSSLDIALGGSKGNANVLVDMLALSARWPAETLYLPASLAARLCCYPDEEMGLAYMESWRETFVVREPAQRPDVPGRNEPCSCGSGKKFKKCCGA